MVRRTSHNTSYSSGVTRPRGIFNAVVKAVGAGVNPAISVTIPRIGLNNIYENVPVIGPTPLVDDNIYVGFMEGNSSAPVAFTSFDDTVGDIDQVIAGTNLNGGGNTGAVTLNLDSDISLTSVTADDLYGDMHGPMHIAVKNVSGVSLSQGDPVYATGAVGASGAIEVQASVASAAATMPSLGLLNQDLANNGEGDVTVSGVLSSFDTDTPGWAVGTVLYVAPAGGLTSTRPTSASHLVQKIGKVIRRQVSTGQILVQGAGRANDVPNSFSTTGDVTIGGDATVVGDLTVNGTTVTLNTETLAVEDNIILLNSNVTGTPTLDAGIEVERGSDTNVSFTWNETTDAWTIGSYDFTVDTSTLHVDSTNNRVGVGTTTPRSEFHVEGSSDPELSITSTDASNPALYFGDSVDSVRGGIRYNTANDRLELQGYNNSTAITIASAGSVGIGTTSPNRLFDLNATTNSYMAFSEGGSEAWVAGYEGGSANRWILYGGTPGGSRDYRLVIDDSGNVGIGTTSPSTPLHVEGDVYLPSGNSYWIGATSDSGGRLRLHHSTDAYIDYYDTMYFRSGSASSVARVVFTSGGSVGINDSTPSYTLDVNGTGRFTGDVITDDLTVNCSSTELKVQGSVSGVQFITRNTGNRWVIYNDTSALRFYVDGSGDRLQITSSQTNVVGQLQVNSGPVLSDPSGANELRVTTAHGYIDIGPKNTSYCHIYTDRTGGFYFNEHINADGGSTVRGNLTVDGTLFVDSTRGLRSITGNYGSVQTTGSGVGGWEGYSVDGWVVFMANSSTGNFGIYDDTYNHWSIYADFNGWVQLNYDNNARVQTSSAGVNIWNTLRLLAASTTEGGETQFDAGSSYTSSAGTYYQDMYLNAHRFFRSGGTGSYHFEFASGLPGTTAGSYMRIYGNRLYYYSSVAEIKEDMYDSGELLEYLNERNPIHSVRPHIFHMKPIDNGDGTFTERSTGNFHHGFIADDFADAIPEAQTADGSGNLGGFDDAAITSLLTAEMQRIVPMLEELYAAAHPDWVPPQPRPPERIENEKAIFEAHLVEEKAKWDESQAQIQAKHPGPSDPPPEAQEVN